MAKGKDMSYAVERRYERKPFVAQIRYYLRESYMGETKTIHREAVSIDISEGGIGMETDYPLEKGNILYFDPPIRESNFEAVCSIVKWSVRVEYNRYRVGLEFVREELY
jgi:c-di-GMP-binding flagellar brake protein YcgR